MTCDTASGQWCWYLLLLKQWQQKVNDLAWHALPSLLTITTTLLQHDYEQLQDLYQFTTGISTMFQLTLPSTSSLVLIKTCFSTIPQIRHCLTEWWDFVVDRIARSFINYWHDNVVCQSVWPSILRLCIVAKWYILHQKCLNKWTGSALLGTRFYNFQPPTPNLFPQTAHPPQNFQIWNSHAQHADHGKKGR